MRTQEKKFCKNCLHELIKSEITEYDWQCVECDEDFYSFETLTEEEVLDEYNGARMSLDEFEEFLEKFDYPDCKNNGLSGRYFDYIWYSVCFEYGEINIYVKTEDIY
jgi:hypothetical protein